VTNRSRPWLGALGVLGLLLSACAAPSGSSAPAANSAESIRAMSVYRSPDCSCCHLWSEIAEQAGWTIVTADKLDMAAFKAETGVPGEAASCHTAIIDGYFVEGHVPLAAIDRLLAERPAIDGIALPGMPAGSPGMGGVAVGPFEILAISGGEITPFGSY
jgi:hypothetical protein